MNVDFITMYYFPENRQHQKALAYAKTWDKDLVVVDLHAEPITPLRLEKLILGMGLTPKDLVNTGHALFTERNESADFSDQDWLRVMVHNHELIRLPILVVNGKPHLIDKPSDVLTLKP
jgi:arsenate reductase